MTIRCRFKKYNKQIFFYTLSKATGPHYLLFFIIADTIRDLLIMHACDIFCDELILLHNIIMLFMKPSCSFMLTVLTASYIRIFMPAAVIIY